MGIIMPAMTKKKIPLVTRKLNFAKTKAINEETKITKLTPLTLTIRLLMKYLRKVGANTSL
jgi:hypothetical protein